MSAGRALVAALIIPLVLLSACAEDDPVPKMPDPTTPTPSTTETAEPETAEEFIRRFNEANVEMQATGESDNFLALTQDCRPCADTAATVEGFYADGGYVKWAGWRILKVTLDGETEQSSEYRIAVRTAVTRYKKERAAEELVLDGGKVLYRASLVKDADSWLMADLVQLSQ